MKKLSLFIIVLLFVVGIQNTQAENTGLENTGILPIQTLRNDTEAKTEEIKKEMEVERKKVRQEIETKKEELKTKMVVLRESIKSEKNTAKAKIKEERITGRENALERFEKVVGNLTEVKDRIGAQIAYFKTKNLDTAGAEAFMVTAENKLNDIKAKIVDAYGLFSNSLDELTPADKTTLQDITKDTQNIINETRDTLNNAVKSLKDSIINKK